MAHHNVNTASISFTDSEETVTNTTFSYSFDNATFESDLTKLEQTEVGKYTIYVKAESTNFKSAATTTAVLEIKQIPVTVTWPTTRQFKFDGKTHAVKPTVTGLIDGFGVTYTVAHAEETAIGTYTAEITFVGEAKDLANYALPDNLKVTWNITENPAVLSQENIDGDAEKCKVIDEDTDTLRASLSPETNVDYPTYTWYRKYPDGDWQKIEGSETYGGYTSDYELTEDDVGAWIKCELTDKLINGTVEAGQTAYVPLYFTKGMGQTYSNDALVTVGTGEDAPFETNGKYGRFLRALVDGKALDASSYDTAEGCTVIILKSDYLYELTDGEHILTAEYENSTSCDTNFIVEHSNKEEAERLANDPYGDHTECLLPVISPAAALAVQLIYYKKKKKLLEEIQALENGENEQEK